jgi:hypothetical protein
MTILNSKGLYEKYGTNMRFYKLTNKKETHNNFLYKSGVNIDILPFNPNPTSRPGGMYFFSEPNLYKFMRYVDQPYYIREVAFDELSLICEDGDNFKTNRFILCDRVDWREYFNSRPALVYEAVKYSSNSIRYVDNQTDKLCLLAVNGDPFSIQYIINPSDEVIRVAIKKNAYVLFSIINRKNLSEDIYMEAIRYKPEIICNTSIQTYPRCLEAVKYNPSCIIYINEEYKTNELYIDALSRDGFVLKQIPNKTPELCKLAVSTSGLVLKWVPEQTQELCDIAVRQDIGAFYYVKDEFKTAELCMYVVKKDGLQLYLIENQTIELCREAIKQNHYACRYISRYKEPEPSVDTKLLMAICNKNIDDVKRYIDGGTRKLNDMSWLKIADKNYDLEIYNLLVCNNYV